MTCVACSSSIERLIHNQFDKRSLVSVSIVLLTNKMFCTFEAHVFHDKIVTPEMVCEEVDCIGFECQLISITEMKGEEQLAKKRRKLVSPPTLIPLGQATGKRKQRVTSQHDVRQTHRRHEQGGV